MPDTFLLDSTDRATVGVRAARSAKKVVSLRTSPFDRDAMRQRILATVDSIPRGFVATYGQIAGEADLGRRARFVGRVLRDLPAKTQLPWHRVVRAGGELAPRAGAREQRQRLRAEGVALDRHGRVDLERYRWRLA